MTKLDEITITKYETEFVAKHKDFDVIGVGSNEFEAVLELSKALGALMFSKETEHEALKRDVARYFELASGKYVEDMQVGKISWTQYTQLDDEEQTLKEKLSTVGKAE